MPKSTATAVNAPERKIATHNLAVSALELGARFYKDGYPISNNPFWDDPEARARFNTGWRLEESAYKARTRAY